MRGRQALEAWRELRPLLRRQARPLTTGLVLVVVNRLAIVAVPLGARVLLDDVVGARRVSLLPFLMGGMVGAVGLGAASAYAVRRLVTVSAQRTTTALCTELHAHVLRLPVAFHDQTPTGAIMARILNDTDGVQLALGPALLEIVSALLTAAIALTLLFRADPSLAVALAIALTVVGLALARGFKRLCAQWLEASDLTARLTTRIVESLAGLRDIKARAAECRTDRFTARAAAGRLVALTRTLSTAAAQNALTGLTTGAVSLLVLCLASRDVIAGSMTLGNLAMVSLLAGLLVSPLVQVAAYGADASRAIASLLRIRELHTRETEDAEDATRGSARVQSLSGTVDFIDVCFAYGGGAPVLRNVTFHAEPGTITALVGATGCGKSTLCSLLLAFHQPTRGRILIDGRDLSTLHRGSYRSHLGVVLQETVLDDQSIADNIRGGQADLSMALVRRAASAARCDAFIASLPAGYDTLIGERGIRLSGGQRQRLTLARAIVADPRILILDEATSNVDAATESHIRAMLYASRGDRTTIVVAHRLSTVEDADHILVFDRGRIVERGKHADLLALRGPYWRLYHSHAAPPSKGDGRPVGQPRAVGSHHCMRCARRLALVSEQTS